MSSRRHHGGGRRWFALPALATALAALLAGCGLGAGPTPGGVRLDVTREFGADSLRSLRAPSAHGQETVMSLLVRNASVATRYGGGFVESVAGRSGGYEGGEPVDWFYYVNGVEAAKGAAETNVHPGDRIWWDLHDWSQTDDVPAVVGSYPEPFLDGIGGLRDPVRVECTQLQGGPCRTVRARLRAAGVRFALAAPGSAGEATSTLRLLVGTWRQVRADPGAQSLERGPRASGVYARVAPGGTIALLDARGATVRTLTGTAGLLAATRYAEEGPEWLITGTDPAGVQLAANALDETALHDRFAVALAATGAMLPLPQPTGT
ncbi:MAG: DUF4430 domain-containing protein [Solirubrobacteraceae bacterium]